MGPLRLGCQKSVETTKNDLTIGTCSAQRLELPQPHIHCMSMGRKYTAVITTCFYFLFPCVYVFSSQKIKKFIIHSNWKPFLCVNIVLCYFKILTYFDLDFFHILSYFSCYVLTSFYLERNPNQFWKVKLQYFSCMQRKLYSNKPSKDSITVSGCYLSFAHVYISFLNLRSK